jgi:hypothetical protein
VKDLLIFDGTSFQWDVSFIRLVQDWELESIVVFMEVIYSVVPSQVGKDTICWEPSFQRVFTVNSFYKVLLPPATRYFPWKSVEAKCSF